MLVSHAGDTKVIALATDGAWLYVVQADSPSTLYSVPAGGGPTTTLDAAPVASPIAWEDGVYVNTNEGTNGAVWVRHDGLARHGVYGGLFSPPDEIDREL